MRENDLFLVVRYQDAVEGPKSMTIVYPADAATGLHKEVRYLFGYDGVITEWTGLYKESPDHFTYSEDKGNAVSTRQVTLAQVQVAVKDIANILNDTRHFPFDPTNPNDRQAGWSFTQMEYGPAKEQVDWAQLEAMYPRKEATPELFAVGAAEHETTLSPIAYEKGGTNKTQRSCLFFREQYDRDQLAVLKEMALEEWKRRGVDINAITDIYVGKNRHEFPAPLTNDSPVELSFTRHWDIMEATDLRDFFSDTSVANFNKRVEAYKADRQKPVGVYEHSKHYGQDRYAHQGDIYRVDFVLNKSSYDWDTREFLALQALCKTEAEAQGFRFVSAFHRSKLCEGTSKVELDISVVVPREKAEAFENHMVEYFNKLPQATLDQLVEEHEAQEKNRAGKNSSTKTQRSQ